MNQNDFSKGSMFRHIITLAGPMFLAQLVHLLYNVVDRIFIGRMPAATYAMSGLGLCLPVITMIIAFANLVGMGGAPLTSIERGKGNNQRAELILGNSFIMLLLLSALIMVFGYALKTPILKAFGASAQTLPYADGYMSVYLLGTPFALISLGLNSFINAQGFGKTGMLTTVIGAVINIILDPVFIFTLHMGVAGAALATILSQFVSAAWTFGFLISKRTILKIRKSNCRLRFAVVKSILSLGLAEFMMQVTNSIVAVVCNRTLAQYGGDVYIAIMTVLNSIREMGFLPSSSFSGAAKPILGYNYGANRPDRVWQGIKLTTVFSFSLLLIFWVIINLFPSQIFRVFTSDEEVIRLGTHAARLYFFGFFMMSLQSSGQAAAVGLNRSGQAIFFSIFRKVVIVAPLTVILPRFMGIDGVFVAEAVSNFIGGLACYITMLLTIGRDLKKQMS